MYRHSGKTLCFLLCVVLVACGRKREPSQPTTDSTLPPASEPAARPAVDTARSGDADARRREEAERIRRILEEMVFFDYDRAELRDDAQRILSAKIPVLRAHTDIRLRIEGHADERGSVEYNLALSLRRANRVRDYLVDVGVPASRLEVAAFGEERPLVEGEGEANWSRNRRAEFVVLGSLTSSAR